MAASQHRIPGVSHQAGVCQQGQARLAGNSPSRGEKTQLGMTQGELGLVLDPEAGAVEVELR